MHFATASSYKRIPVRSTASNMTFSARSPWTAMIIASAVIWMIYMIQNGSQARHSAMVDRMKGDISSVKVEDHTATKSEKGGVGWVVGTKEKPKSTGWPFKSSFNRPLILYAYAESPIARRNLQYFIAHGLHSSADFTFILNGDTDVDKLLPSDLNIKFVKRKNDCYDLGAYGEILMKDDLYKKYKRFIMLNASIRGPFLPYWSEQCWSDMFLRRVTDKVKLVGITSNCWPQPHVQSMIWATDSVGIKNLLFPRVTENDPDRKGIGQCFHNWTSAVSGEVGASQIILDAGYKLDVMMTMFHADDDFIAHCDSSQNGDFLWNGKYNGTNIQPYETIFIKTNRDIDPTLMERLTDWHDRGNYSSWERCMS